ncbi:hypothetical protein BAY59_34755 [Prauserella coralliicola]|nr:hypothetical protein BAY59_34755 [Prauserella coralliicola]
MASSRLSGKVAIVTGAAHGIGAAIARSFVAEGAHVVLADIADAALGTLAGELGPQAAPVHCDVSSGDDVLATVKFTVETFGGLDVVVNNAATGSSSMLVDMRQKEWERAFAIGVGGVFHTIRHATPVMRERGGGAFVNISSAAGRRAARGMAAYSAAKASVEALTRCAALELREDGIRVNAIVPGMIRTGAAQGNSEFLGQAVGMELAEYVAKHQGRWGEPAEVAAVAVHLASAEAAFTTGHMYVLDNGATTQL